MIGHAEVMELGRAPSGRERRRLLCHLTLAAEGLARESAADADALRYRRLAARLRDLMHADGMPHRNAGPVVATLVGDDIPLVALLRRAWQDRGWTGSSHDVCPELIDASRQLLRELNWHLPD
jgi:hypothetical protein